MGKKVSLVLGSGGARGYAHMGVIETLEAKGYEIVSISGASMGALVGGLYACGKLDEYREWVLKLGPLDVAGLLDLSWDKRGFMNGTKVFDQLEHMVGQQKIEALPIRFTAVACDLNRNKEVWFQNGDLLTAIRASIAIPSVFTPVQLDDMLLVDGGVLNPLPVAPTMSDHSDMTIAVNVYAEADESLNPVSVAERYDALFDEDDSLFGKVAGMAKNALVERKKRRSSVHLFSILDRTFEAMQQTLIQYRLGGYPPDVMIDIPQNVCGIFDFHKAEVVIDAGRKAAEKVL